MYYYIVNPRKDKQIEYLLDKALHFRYKDSAQSYVIANEIFELSPTKSIYFAGTLILIAGYWEPNINYDKTEYYYLKTYQCKEDTSIESRRTQNIKIDDFLWIIFVDLH